MPRVTFRPVGLVPFIVSIPDLCFLGLDLFLAAPAALLWGARGRATAFSICYIGMLALASWVAFLEFRLLFALSCSFLALLALFVTFMLVAPVGFWSLVVQRFHKLLA